jgi:hypothetical protein
MLSNAARLGASSLLQSVRLMGVIIPGCRAPREANLNGR